MILSGTGHRPNKLVAHGKQAYPNPNTYGFGYAYSRLIDLAYAYLLKLKPAKVVSGMALGWDLALAQAALYAEIPYIAAVPFRGQESQWPESSQKYYRAVLSMAESIEYISPGEYSAWKMQSRNKWMVDHSDTVLALWNGTPGGTANCIKYAEETKIHIINAWDSWDNHKEDRFEFSNFGLADVPYGGIIYPSVENFYQAMKTTNPVMRKHIASVSPEEAKALGRKVTLRTDIDWDNIKEEIMRTGLHIKFSENKEWLRKLLATKGKPLIEWNTWDDTFWGKDIKSEQGDNRLGTLLEEIREVHRPPGEE